MVNSLGVLLKILYFYTAKLFRIKGYGISLIVPLGLSELDGQRAKNWEWLKAYWKANLPGAEIIIGRDEDISETRPFSKSVAVNNGVSKSHGDILVIIDADAYISAETILECAAEIRIARAKNFKLWFIPYRHLYRLTRTATKEILDSSPSLAFPQDRPREEDYSNKGFFKNIPVSEIGHWYGAMIQILPEEAFEEAGGWDPRFRGWGGEDHAAMVATDTLYTPHKTIRGPVFHLWHPVVTPGSLDSNKRRLWGNQNAEHTNDKLSARYYWASGNKERMRVLVDEFKHHRHRHHKPPVPPCDPPVST